MIGSEKNFVKNEETPSFKEVSYGDITKFVCNLGNNEVGYISATLVSENVYNISGLFVGPSQRGKGISSNLIKLVNSFLDKNHSTGKLINTIQGDAAKLYENNGWKKQEYKSQGAYGGYEYTYNS